MDFVNVFNHFRIMPSLMKKRSLNLHILECLKSTQCDATQLNSQLIKASILFALEGQSSFQSI